MTTGNSKANIGGTSADAQALNRHKSYMAMGREELRKLYKSKCRSFRDLNNEVAEIRGALVALQEIEGKEAELAAVKGKHAKHVAGGA